MYNINILVIYCTSLEKYVAYKLRDSICSECRNVSIDVRSIKHIDSINLIDYDHVIAIMPLPVLVRKICHKLIDKLIDPSITLITPDLRYIIPICGEHSKLGIDIALLVQDILNSGKVISTCRDKYYECIEYFIAKLKLCIEYSSDIRYVKDVFKKRMFKIYVDGCDKICSIVSRYFSNFKLVNNVRDADLIITKYSYDSNVGKIILRYPIIELYISDRVSLLNYALCSVAQCIFTIPDRFDIVILSSSMSDGFFEIRQYFLS